MRFLAFVLTCLTIASADGIEIRVESSSPEEIVLGVTIKAQDYPIVERFHGPARFHNIMHLESLGGAPGTPDLPRFHRYLVVEPGRRYRAKVELHDGETFSRILLHPVQPELLETEAERPLVHNHKSYSSQRWLGGETAILGPRARLGNLNLLPVTLTPFQYLPAKRKLRLYKKFRVRITSAASLVEEPASGAPSDFARQVAPSLVLNPEALKTAGRAPPHEHLILTSDSLLSQANLLGALYPHNSVAVRFETVPAGATSQTVKDTLKAAYAKYGLDSVLIFGNESQIPMHQWSTSLPGDSFYTYLDGEDWISDVSIGRLPVADGAQADAMVKRLRAYRELQESGFVSKKVMMIAHRENYPGKYTANSEAVRKAENPLGLEFDTQYGGAHATNTTVLSSAEDGFAIVNYRGHGSDTAWTSWAKDGKSFSKDQVSKLPAAGKNMPVVLSIACNTGALQRPLPSLSEMFLFPSLPDNAGAIAVLASTMPSYTSTNDRFQVHLFEALQGAEYPTLGSLVAAANNRLVKDNGGAIPENVKMYLLLGDPLLVPWVK